MVTYRELVMYRLGLFIAGFTRQINVSEEIDISQVTVSPTHCLRVFLIKTKPTFGVNAGNLNTSPLNVLETRCKSVQTNGLVSGSLVERSFKN